ncbi:unnamed protein product [Ceutorhynchus assimilis]|uniref:Uncharacterized protein n=1 Tax=Ceutorhynchus assimilis TaxID=467358 RepID=A0A9N9QIC2_9CUCU|nr:unnamed protein product [Ceutorhynchus assimilis]
MDCEPYSRKQFLRKLVDYFGQRICITEITGERTILNFRDNIDSILFNSWYTRKLENSEADERLRVVQKAAEIIKEDIRAAIYDCSVYPPADNPQFYAIFLKV